MAHYLPPAIMRFFQPRPPIEYASPLAKRKMPEYMGVAEHAKRFDNNVPISKPQIIS